VVIGTVASNATVKDSSASLLYCYTGQYSTSDACNACNADTTVVTLVSTGAHYTMGATTPGAFNATTTAGDDDGFIQFESKFTRNSLGQADSVTLGPLTMKYVYDQYNGLLTTTTLPNNSTRTDQYTTNNELYNWTYSDATINPLYRRSYRVDLLGRVTSEQMGNPGAPLDYQVNREVAYDTLGHVSQVNWSNQTCMAWPGSNPDSLSADQGWRYLCNPSALFSESYSYDAVGNRTDGGAVYSLGNRLTSVSSATSSATYAYDADGDVTSRTDTGTGQLMQFYWDAGSQLDSVLISGGGQPSYHVGYRYDPYGRLVFRTSTSGSTERLYLYGAGSSNSSNIAKEVDLGTGHTTEYEYSGVDHPTMSVTRDSTGAVLSSGTYMMDGLGNVIGFTPDATGTIILYDSWGNVKTNATELSTLRFGFKGMLYDETTGLYNARARWYQPDVGRFMSEDPLGLSGGINQYAFAADDPINNSDPSGALVTDAQGSTCSINATDCGDPLQMPGGAGNGAVLFALSGGPTGGDVSYAGQSVAHGLIIVDKNLRTAFDAFIKVNPNVGSYLTELEASSSLFIIFDVPAHPWAQWAAIGEGWSYGGLGTDKKSQQGIVDSLASSLGYSGALGIGVIQSDEARLAGHDLGKVVAHEALHLSGLLTIGRRYLHNEGPFAILGCTILNCQP
jgi:RHS repeat-associated protein